MDEVRAWVEARGPQRALPPRARVGSDAPATSLNGTWLFRYTPRLLDAPAIADGAGRWDEIAVPGIWQLQGHGAPVYLSAQYPFPLDPPRIPDENAVGDYRLTFDAGEEYLAGAVLRFDGIDSSGLVWLNGHELGWTRGSRLTHEFDVTGLLREHGNELVVRVVQYSAGSYLEAQDVWWMSGIFRDVTLAGRPPGGVRDVRVVADYDPETGDGLLTVVVDADDSQHCAGRLDGFGEVPVNGTVTRLPGVDPWLAERPVLYDLAVGTPAETVTLRVGFRRVEIADGLLRVNGTPIRLRGVNRHDHDPERGRATTPESIRRDLVMMKRANVNAIRTAHYPPRPELLDLADELGFWVIEEGDIETHGFVLAGFRNNPVDDPAWQDAVLDRTARMVGRDRNHPSVIVWSLGNEAGGGRCLAAAYDWVKQVDPSRPVHYERDRSYAYSDFFSLMYTSPDRLEEIGRGIDRPDEPQTSGPLDKPFILCEYGHAMGAGPGALDVYEELFDTYPRLQGGFIWEWCDHTIWTTTPDGTRYPGYGGDFGEVLHDGNFVADGLVAGDRTARPALADLAATFAPFRIEIAADASSVRIVNRHDFIAGDGFVVSWRLEDAAGELGHGRLAWPEPPRCRGGAVELQLPVAADPHARGTAAVLTVAVRTASAPGWAAEPVEVAIGQLAVGMERTDLRPGSSEVPQPTPDGHRLPVARFDSEGLLTELQGVAVTGGAVGLWRAPTDNDRGLNMKSIGQPADADEWARSNLVQLHRRTEQAVAGPEGLVVSSRVAPLSRDYGLLVRHTWRQAGPCLLLEAEAEPTGPWEGSWARIGLDFELPDVEPEARLRWRGRGPIPGGPDSGQGARWGWFESTVAGWQVEYARPQDNGTRAGVTILQLELADGRWLEVRSGSPLYVSLRRWSDLELDRADHWHELPASTRAVLSLNAAIHGLGSGACGPSVLDRHRLHPRAARWNLRFQVDEYPFSLA